MPVNQIVITGLEAVQLKLSQLKQQLNPVLEQATLNVVLYAHSHIPPYPPAPPNSTYIRTHLLENSYTVMQGQAPGAVSRVEELGGNFVGVIGTNVEYARWVIDRDRQAWMHQGRWWLLQDEILKLEPGIRSIYQDYVNNFIATV